MPCYVALRFFEDGNLADRVYWYLCDLTVTVGERVLAPVGSHDRLQLASVERVQSTEGTAPYDVRLMKHVAARYGVHALSLKSGFVCRELGGFRYDYKRFTRFGKLLSAEGIPSEQDRSELLEYGIGGIFVLQGGEDVFLESGEAQRTLNAVAATKTGALLCGERKCVTETVFALLSLAGVRLPAESLEKIDPALLEAVRERGGMDGYLANIGLARGVLHALKERLH